MKTVRNIVLAAAAGALALGASAYAQDAKQPEPQAKPKAESRGERHQHRGEHRRHGMKDMQENCHGKSGRQEHDHS
jgi:opacity protein-like surface antigen